MKTPLIIISVVILAVAGWLLISNTGQHQNMNTDKNTVTQNDSSPKYDKVPNFRLQDYNGKTVDLADFAGKPAVINSWAAWCPFCRKELVDFAAAQKEFGESIVIIAIDRAESREVAKKYSDELGVTSDLVFLLNPSDSFYQSIGGFSMPETIFVDKNGNIVDHKRGPMDLNEIRERAQKILMGAPTSQNAPTAVVENIVAYGESGFSPNTLRVKVGAAVTFKNEESEPMWVASNPHPIHTAYLGFDAKRGYSKSENYSFTFTKSGIWKYHNHLNPGEGGTIVVE